MKRVLHCLNSLGYGGVESTLINIYRNIDREEYQFDFLIRTPIDQCNQKMVREIGDFGGEIYETPTIPKHILKNILELNEFLKENAKKYAAIQIHANSFLYVAPLVLAKIHKLPIRIIHSRNSRAGKKAYFMLHYMNRIFFLRFANCRVACSDLAGKWMYGKKTYILIRNNTDLLRFKYDEGVRNALRKELGVDGRTVIGSIGRFSPQKNYPLILKIFFEYLKINPEAVLVLAGNGELLESIQSLSRVLGLSDKVLFLGYRTDTDRLYQAMDLFLMPSLFEGLPNALVEAQAAGLPCLISDAISEDSIATENVVRCGLSDPPEVWAQKMERMLQSFQRKDTYEVMKNKGWDISTEVQELEKIYQI